jgi:transcriptional regulator with GAF, ATPase, and Fis domain
MTVQTSWASEKPAVDYNASFEIGNAASANFALDSDQRLGRGLPRIFGRSAALQRVLDMVPVVAPTDATVLINGETGTGKEPIAEAIHKSSSRSQGPLVKVNCAAIPAGLLESELFGHERGAYTGAVARGIGRFERAHRGTLFLDESGDLPLAMVNEGECRADLFYRLSAFPVELPPLRERPRRYPWLVHHFAKGLRTLRIPRDVNNRLRDM